MLDTALFNSFMLLILIFRRESNAVSVNSQIKQLKEELKEMEEINEILTRVSAVLCSLGSLFFGKTAGTRYKKCTTIL